MTWSFEWLRSWDEVWDPRHVATWRAMCEAAGAHATPFVHPDLVRGWLGPMGGPAAYEPFFLHARHSGGQRVLWPLVRPRSGWERGLLRRLVPAGDGPGGPYFAYNDPLVAPALERVLAPGFWPAFERELQGHAGSWFDRCTLHRMRPECLGEVTGEPVAKGSTYVRTRRLCRFRRLRGRASAGAGEPGRAQAPPARGGRPRRVPHARPGRARGGAGVAA